MFHVTAFGFVGCILFFRCSIFLLDDQDDIFQDRLTPFWSVLHTSTELRLRVSSIRQHFRYPLVNVYITMENLGKSPCLMGKSTINDYKITRGYVFSPRGSGFFSNVSFSQHSWTTGTSVEQLQSFFAGYGQAMEKGGLPSGELTFCHGKIHHF